MKTRFFLKKLSTSLLLSFVFSILAFAIQDNKVTIVGTVTAWEWDDDNNATAIAISTEDDDYVVGQNDLGNELLELLDHEVEVTGTVSVNDDDEKVIMVTEYKDFGIVETEDEDESEPEEF